MRLRYLSLFIIALAACSENKDSLRKTAPQIVTALIEQGDSIYSRKAGYTDFLQSLELYDSAYRMAQAANDTGLIADAVYAKGRAYDAINNNPQKTIDLYTEAADLIMRIPGRYNEGLYVKHLVAHSYDKVNDSAHCAAVLQQLYMEIYPKPDSIKKQLRFTAEMALISTVVRNYDLANAILKNLTKREWIKNDSTEYDYLNHYYLTKARLDVSGNSYTHSPYLDSLEMVFNNSRNFSDSAFFSDALMSLFRAAGNAEKGKFYESVNFHVNEKMNAPGNLQKMQERLAQMETASVESKRKEAATLLQNRTTVTWLLGVLLLAISAFAFFLIRKNREILKKKTELQQTNDKLYEKDIQNELLNKEIHHRVKNNLQMILSLVYMQERTTQTEEAKNNLQDIRMRIESVAALHEQLVEQNSDVVDLKNYVTKMVNAVASLVENNQHIFTHLEIDPVTIPVKQSFPLGQLLNEWITNTIKHAGSGNESLAIYISIKKVHDMIRVQYSDSGRAVAKSGVTDKLGMSIVDLLVTQLNGELERTEKDYFTYTLTFDSDGK